MLRFVFDPTVDWPTRIAIVVTLVGVPLVLIGIPIYLLSGGLKTFGLGALQGGVGWWMVASGLSQRVEVSQYRLATHLVLALLIFAAVVWTLRRLVDRPRSVASLRLKMTSVALLVVTFVQLYLGALVAGLRAGLVYNTWPAIDGAFIPSSERLWFETPWWRNLFENALTVQFEHRMTAYLLFALAIAHAIDAVRARAGSAVIAGAWWLVKAT